MYHYWACGITIASQIEFPELLPFNYTTAPDVTISIGITPDTLTGADVMHKVGCSISPNEYLLKLLNIANYYASNGNSIIIEPLAAADDKSVRLFLLDSVLAAILHQRDQVILHASAVEYNDGVVLICGPVNSGKSILAAKLQQQGYPLFSDDVCVLQPDINGQILAIPSYPTLKLWEDSFEKLGMPIPDETNKIRPLLPKYSISYRDKFDAGPKPVKQIYLLSRATQQGDIEIKKLSALDGFRIVHDNIFHRLQIYPMKKQASNFSIVSKLTASVPVFSVTICDDNAIAELSEVVTSNMIANG